MVSYAVPGGTVGPHVDSYDVFLIQGSGRRRWQVSRQKDLAFVPGLDLKILARFEPEEEWVLEPGDMLYLPPDVAHYGIAETECLTWSVGFRAPSDQELAAGFLDYLGERLRFEGRYADPGLAPARAPGRIPPELLAHVERTLARVRWNRADAIEFAGRFLSEPKAHVYFTPPARPVPRSRFDAAAARRGLALDRRARLLHAGGKFFLNGERVPRAPGLRRRGCASSPTHATLCRWRVRRPPSWIWRMNGTPGASCTWAKEGAIHEHARQARTQGLLPADRGQRAIPRGHRRGDRGGAEAPLDLRLHPRPARLRQSRRASRSFATSSWRGARTGSASRCTSRSSSSATSRASSSCCGSSRPRSPSTAPWARRAIATDPFIVADDHSVWHLLHHEQHRAIVALHSPQDASPLRDRFEEIWVLTEPAVGSIDARPLK